MTLGSAPAHVRLIETPADLKPDREHVCHRAASHDPLEGLPLE
jgi:hypothetical protein